VAQFALPPLTPNSLLLRSDLDGVVNFGEYGGISVPWPDRRANKHRGIEKKYKINAPFSSLTVIYTANKLTYGWFLIGLLFVCVKGKSPDAFYKILLPFYHGIYGTDIKKVSNVNCWTNIERIKEPSRHMIDAKSRIILQ
jgi:hypothetical protein